MQCNYIKKNIKPYLKLTRYCTKDEKRLSFITQKLSLIFRYYTLIYIIDTKISQLNDSYILSRKSAFSTAY